MPSFTSQVGDWAKGVEGAIEAIWKQSTQETVNDMQTPRGGGGRMPVDTGFLRASLMASTSMMPPIISGHRPVPGSTHPYIDSDITSTIIGAELGQTLYFGYTADYAIHREYGSVNNPPDAFVRTAVQKWPETVKRVEADLMTKFGVV